MNRSAIHAGFVVLLLLILPHSFVPRASAGSLAARTLNDAEAAYRAGEWARAAAMYAGLAAENPAQGAFWYFRATAEYNLKQYDNAVTHYQRAIDVGFRVGTAYYNMSCCHALMGRTDAAIDALQLAIDNGLSRREQYIREDADFNAIRDSAQFKARILPSAEGLIRDAGWQLDIAYLSRRVAETHYDPFRYVSREEWDAEVARISATVPAMKDHEVVVALMQLMVRINDGHTVAYPPREGRLAFHSLPLEIYEFEDGFFVRRADSRYADLVGKRLVQLGTMPVQEALERVSTAIPRDNTQQIRWMSGWYLRNVEILNAMGVAPGLDAVDVTVADAQGKEIRRSVGAEPMRPFHEAAESTGWKDMASPADELPLWRRHMDKNYWFEFIEESGIVYVGFHRVRNAEDESLEAFAHRLFAFIDTNPVVALVVDVRLNNGGNNTLARPLFLNIVGSEKINRNGHLFVITGRQTFSACQNFCNWLDRDSNVLFVGEATGSKPNFVGEDNPIVLPYSGLTVSASSRLWQDAFSDDQRHWIAPHIGAPMTSADYRDNRDPCMEAIGEFLGARATAASN